MAKYTHDEDDEEDTPPPRRRARRPAARMSLFRFVSPGTFGLAAILFFLPWTDLSCQMKGEAKQIVVQSGYEAAAGEVSEGAAIQKEREALGGKAKADVKPEKALREAGKKAGGRDEMETAPLLWVYLLLVIGGAAAPAFIAPDKVRGGIVVGLAGAALLILVGQAAVGFPLAKLATRFQAEAKKADDLRQKMAADRPGFNPPVPETGAFRSGFLLSFWLSAAVLVGAAAVGVLDLVRGPAAPPRRRYRRDEEDEGEEDEDDDRDRRRRPRRRDDDD